MKDTHVFSVCISSSRLARQLHQVVQLVQELLGGAVDLCVGLAHGLVQGLVLVDGRLQGRNVAGRV